MKFTNVTIAGSGVLGSQIAYQTAFSGFNVTIYDINDEILEKAKQRVDGLSKTYLKETDANQGQVDSAKAHIKFSSDLADAVSDADLVIEAIPEVMKIKSDFYSKLGKVAPEKTIFATNTSTLLPSMFAKDTGRPTKFIALHFANELWKLNIAEIMGHPGTDPVVYDEIVEFAIEIGMVPITIKKEQPGYILNSLIVPWLTAAQTLQVTGVGSFQTIDKTWMKATNSPMGPFAILDIVGITTAYNIVKMKADAGNDEGAQKLADYLKTEFIDKGKLGVSTGQGFYTYPNPEWQSPDFLSVTPELLKA